MRRNKKLIVLMVFVIIAAVAVCVKSAKNTTKQTLTVTDPDGITYLAVFDQNNNVYAGITDAQGNLYGARIDESGYPVLDESLYVVGEYDGTLPKNNTTAVEIKQTGSQETYDYNAEVSIVDKDKTTADTANSSTDTTGGSDTSDVTEAKEYLAEKYLKLFASGTYQMEFSTDDPQLQGDILMAFKNGNIYLETTVEGMDAQVIYNDSTKEGAIVIPSVRIYCTLPDDMLDEMAGGTLDMGEVAEYKSVKEYKVSINGRECDCESYTYSDGATKNYYFYNGELVRMDFIEKDGSSSIYNVISVSSDVPDSYFETPKGYLKLNAAKLLEQYGEDE